VLVESDIGWGINYALTDTSVYGYQALVKDGALNPSNMLPLDGIQEEVLICHL